jgi:hypothetical protein
MWRAQDQPSHGESLFLCGKQRLFVLAYCFKTEYVNLTKGNENCLGAMQVMLVMQVQDSTEERTQLSIQYREGTADSVAAREGMRLQSPPRHTPPLRGPSWHRPLSAHGPFPPDEAA